MSNADLSEYANLLTFLEKHEKKLLAKPKVTKPPPKKKSGDKNTKEHVKKLTQEMMKETEAFSFVPAHVKKKYPTEGFNIRLFEEKLVKKLVEKHKKLQSYERPYIAVSELLYCLRSCYYYRKKYSIDLKKKFGFPYVYLKQRVGNAIHDAVQDVYGFDEVEKTVISQKFQVKGRLDALNDDIYVIDFKPSEDFKSEVDLKHFDQGNIYATILNTEYDYSVKKVVIVYYLLNFKNMQIFVSDVDLNRGLEFLKRGKQLKDHLDNNLVIDPIGATEKDCQFCPYVEYCDKDKFKSVAPPKRFKKQTTKIETTKIEKPIKKPKKRPKKKFEYEDPKDGFLI